MIPPSGEQYEITYGEQRATVVEVGGAIREYYVGERPVLDPFPLDAIADGAHGNPLVPWPNRLADGAYEFNGQKQQTALTEPDKGNAIHGLLRCQPWRVGARARPGGDGCADQPQKGFPFTLDVSVVYELTDDGLVVTTSATNIGQGACPYGTGQHPYLSPGDGLIDDCTLQFGAATRIDTDPERQLPTGRVPVDGTPYDFHEPRRLGDFQMDYAFTGLIRDGEGKAWARLGAPDGTTAELWVDESYGFLEVFTGDSLAPGRARHGLACEPMTCAPNAFNTGDGLVRLESGSTHRARWGARLA